MSGGKGRRPDLGPVKEDVSEPVLAFVLRLRELYEESGWTSLQAFAQAVAYDRGTISRFLSGHRQPKAYFLDKLFAAMEDHTGRAVPEAVRADTRRLYFESVRLTAPAEYQLFRMEEELRAAHDEMRQRLDEQRTAHARARKALTGQITELSDSLRQMQDERQDLLHRSERLTEQARVEGERRTFLEHVLEDVLRLQDGGVLALTPAQQPPQHWPLTGLVLGDRTGTVDEMALSPGGALIARVDSQGTLRFWEPAASRSPVRTLHHDRAQRTLDFHVGRRLLATACQDGSAWLWKPDAGRSAEPERLGSQITEVRAVAFAPRSDGLLAIAGLGGGAVKLWDMTMGTQAAGPLNGHEGPVHAIAFSPDGRHIASGSADGTVQLWDPLAASPTGRRLTGHTGPVRCIAFSPDGHLVASTSDDATVRFWSPATGRPLGKPLTGHHGPVTGLSFAPQGGLLSTTGTDRTVRIWPHPAT